MKPVNRRVFLLVAALTMATLACTQLTVTNDSLWELRVAVSLPGGRGPDVHVYQPGASYDYYPDTAGSYTITVYPGEAYLDFMNQVKTNTGRILIDKHAELTPSMVAQLVEGITSVDRVLSSLHEASCTGTLVQDETVYAKVKFTSLGAYLMDCP